MATVKFIWTKSAIEKWANGKADPAHTISSTNVPNIADVYAHYARNLRKDTPWVLVDDDVILDTGTSGFPRELLV